MSENTKRRFSGYQLNLLTWDGTGPSYIMSAPHPANASIKPLWTTAKGIGEWGKTFTSAERTRTDKNFPVL